MRLIFRSIAYAAVALSIFTGAATAQHAGTAEFQIKDSDGELNTNFALQPELTIKLAALAAQMPVGNVKGDVTLYQFYDLNCPYCREAARDVDALVRADSKLKLVLVPYAVLSVQSVQGALIEVGASKSLTPEQYL